MQIFSTFCCKNMHFFVKLLLFFDICLQIDTKNAAIVPIFVADKLADRLPK